MPLTEEEKTAVEMYRTSQYSVAKIIDRLLAGNEELQGDKKHLLGVAQMLQFKLDAIKKAWEPLCDLIPADVRNLQGVGDSNYVNAKVGLLKALDRLIGGE